MNGRPKDQNEKKMKPRGIVRLLVKCLLWTLAGIVVLLCLLLAFTQTPIFRDRLLDFAVGRANEMLEGRLAVEHLDGNLFTRLQMNGILLKSGGDTILAVTRLEAVYAPSKLLDRIIAIDSVMIEAPYVKLNQAADSSWNVSRLLKQKTEPESAGAEDEPFGWTVSVGGLGLSNGDIRISAIDTIIPARITGLDIGLMGSWSAERWELDLQKFTLRTFEPSIYLETLTFESEGDDKRLSLQDLILRTARNKIGADVTWFLDRTGRSSATLETGPLDVSEFEGFIALPFRALHPSITAEAVYNNDRLDLDCTVKADTQRISLDAGVSGFSAVISSASGEPAVFEADICIRSLDPAQWLGDSALAGLLNGDLHLKGSGTGTSDIELDAVASFSDCRIFQKHLHAASLEAEYSAGDAECRVDMISEFGRAMIDAGIEGVNAERAYTLAAKLQEIDIALLTGNYSLSSDINGDLEARGRGIDPRTMNTELYLTLSPTLLPGFEIDTMTTRARIEQGNCIIDTLHLGSSPAEIVASGRISLTSYEADLLCSIRVGELMGFAPFVGADTISASGSLKGSISGTTDSLRAEAELQLRNIVFNEFSVDSLSGTAFFTRSGEVPGGGGSLTAYKARMPKAVVDTIGIRTEYKHPKTDVNLDIRHGKDFSAALEAAFIPDSIPQITIGKITVDSKGTIWTGGSEDMRILLEGDAYHINNFEIGMKSDSAAEKQLVRAEGVLSMSGDEDLRLEIAGLDLGVMSGIFEMPVELDGLFDLDVTLQGTAQQPLVQGSASVTGGRVNRFKYKELGGTFGYSDSRLAWDFNLIPIEGNSLNITGSLPADIALSGQPDFLTPQRELDVKIKTGGLPLSLLTAGRFDLEEIEGRLECDINIHNTFDTPLFDGYLRVRDGRIVARKLGIVLDDIQLEATLDSTRLLLDRLHVLNDPGTLDASGYIDFDSTIASGVITGALFDLAVREFYLVNNRNAELAISGGIKLKSEDGAPVFSGRMEILRSSFYLPSFLDASLSSPGGDAVPMLVEATRADATGLDSLGTGLPEKLAEPEEETPPFFERLKGELVVTIPRNTWIKSPEMRLELSGDFNIVKKEEIFEPFGTIKIERGHFNLFGKYFQVKTGRISFEGGEKINPKILLEAEYEFRTPSREKKALKVSITGKRDNPIFKFTVDNRELNEGEAISLILFGQMPDELLYGEKSGEGGGGGTGLASSLLSYQLSKTIGKTFDVDYIEVKSEDNWNSASVYVGKYVTNDLFLSYQRGFGDNQYDNTNVEVITMEYELHKYFYLQLIQGDTNTSGYDLIFKIDR